MFGACALGSTGGTQTLEILKRQLQQVMEQLGCEKIEDLPLHLID
jgi:L-lactate dehydrogenase (cytochrome)